MLGGDFVSNADFERYKTLLHRESGINFTDTNKSVMTQKLRSCLRERKMNSAGAYYDLITKDKNELKYFLDAVTTNLTWFFRNESQFIALEKYALPEIFRVKKPGDNVVRVWSAGCSTGEEPYSLAILLSESLPAGWKYKIVAGDISLKCLMTAKDGVYEKRKIMNEYIKKVFPVPELIVSKYFDETERGFKVKDSLKANINFDYSNLKHPPMWENFDVVFCRNVFIYFDDAARLEAAGHFWDAMAEHSFIFIGHSETLLDIKTKFEFVKTRWATCYRKWPGCKAGLNAAGLRNAVADMAAAGF